MTSDPSDPRIPGRPSSFSGAEEEGWLKTTEGQPRASESSGGSTAGAERWSQPGALPLSRFQGGAGTQSYSGCDPRTMQTLLDGWITLTPARGLLPALLISLKFRESMVGESPFLTGSACPLSPSLHSIICSSIYTTKQPEGLLCTGMRVRPQANRHHPCPLEAVQSGKQTHSTNCDSGLTQSTGKARAGLGCGHLCPPDLSPPDGPTSPWALEETVPAKPVADTSAHLLVVLLVIICWEEVKAGLPGEVANRLKSEDSATFPIIHSFIQ